MSASRSPLARLTRAVRRRLTPREASGPAAADGAADAAGRPVFVLGNQKSGTTAIAALLAECIGEPFRSDVLYTHKLQLKDLLESRPSLGELAADHPEAFDATVVKDNDFIFLYPQLVRAFPDARFVYIVRDPRQNIRSILNRLTLPGDLETLSEEQEAQLETRLKGWHTILTGASFGSGGGQYIDVLADRWVRAAETYLEAADRMTLVRYEDFDAAKRPTIEALAAELGFRVAHDITERQDHQYQPLGDRSVTPEQFFGPNLARIEARCGPLMPRFGYEPTARQGG